MKTFSFLFFICLISQGLFAQAAANENWLNAGLSLSLHYQHKNATELITNKNGFQTTYGYQEAASVNLGLGWQQIQENGWYWNYAITGLAFSVQDDITIIELSSQGIPEPTGGHHITRLAFYSRIEYGKLFGRDQEARIFPSLSVSIDPYYQFMHLTPKTWAGFPRSVHHLGLSLRAIPGLTFQLSPGLQLFVKIPVGLNNLEFEYHQIDSPILTDTERKTHRVTNQLGLYDIQGLLGLNFRL